MMAEIGHKNKIITELGHFLTDGERIYLFIIFLYVSYLILQTTMFPFTGYLQEDGIWTVVFMGIVFKTLVLDEWRYTEAIPAVLLVGIGIIINYFGGGNLPLRQVMLIIGAKNVDYRKILSVHLSVRLVVVVSAVFASMTGMIENLQYIRKGEIRNSFGIVYPTDFGAQLFFGYLTFLAITHSVRRVWHWLAGLALAWFIYAYCGARWNAGMLVACVLGFVLMEGDGLKKRKKHRDFALLWGSILSVPVIAGATAANIRMSELKQEFLQWMMQYSKSYGSRMEISVRMLRRYPIGLWGQSVKMQGFGGDVTLPDTITEITFLDISYVNILLRFGIVFSAALFVIYVGICLKYRCRREILLILMLVALSGFMEHHIFELAYNPFFLLLFAKGDGVDEDKRLLGRCEN